LEKHLLYLDFGGISHQLDMQNAAQVLAGGKSLSWQKKVNTPRGSATAKRFWFAWIVTPHVKPSMLTGFVMRKEKALEKNVAKSSSHHPDLNLKTPKL